MRNAGPQMPVFHSRYIHAPGITRLSASGRDPRRSPSQVVSTVITWTSQAKTSTLHRHRPWTNRSHFALLSSVSHVDKQRRPQADTTANNSVRNRAATTHCTEDDVPGWSKGRASLSGFPPINNDWRWKWRHRPLWHSPMAGARLQYTLLQWRNPRAVHFGLTS